MGMKGLIYIHIHREKIHNFKKHDKNYIENKYEESDTKMLNVLVCVSRFRTDGSSTVPPPKQVSASPS